MNIFLLPQRRDDILLLVKAGDSLILNGEMFDFSPMANGDTLPRSAIASEWFASNIDVEKDSGEITLTLVLPIPANFSQEQAFPQPLLNVPDGQVIFPAPLTDLIDEPSSEAA